MVLKPTENSTDNKPAVQGERVRLDDDYVMVNHTGPPAAKGEILQ